MSLPAQLQVFADKPQLVLDDGHVLLVDVLGDEQSIVNAARVSYGAGTRRVSEDKHLLRYLMRHSHTTPFEMCEIVLRVRVPMDCWRQWIRHRTASVNEYSTRYSEAIDSAQRTPANGWRAQATDNKQGSSGVVKLWPGEGQPGEFLQKYGTHEGSYALRGISMDDQYAHPGSYLSAKEEKLQRLAREVYEERIAFGVAREVARKDLPLSTYTEAYWKCDLKNLLHFLSLRMDPHAQKEIRDYANAIAEIVKLWVPNVWAAFEDYDLRRGGLLLSRMEVAGLKHLLWTLAAPQADQIALALDGSGLPLVDAKGNPAREAQEFRDKLGRFMHRPEA